MNPNQIPGGHRISNFTEFCVFVGGSPDSFIGQLLYLFAKADADNLRRLLTAYPEVGYPWLMWRETLMSLTVDELMDRAVRLAKVDGIELVKVG